MTKRITKNKRIVSPDNIRLVNGVSAGLEVISWIIADPQDVILVPEPIFKRFFSNMNERMKTNVIGFQLRGKGSLDRHFLISLYLENSHL